MKVASVAALTLYVKDPLRSADFYGELGFIVSKRSAEHSTIRLNWFKIDLIGQDSEEKEEFQAEAAAEPRGSGIYIDLSVANVDECYNEIIAKGLKPASAPRDWPWGNREFVLRDPDGYKLVFFQKR